VSTFESVLLKKPEQGVLAHSVVVKITVVKYKGFSVKKNNLIIGSPILGGLLTLCLSLPTHAATVKNETLSVIGRAPVITSVQPDNFAPNVGDRVTISAITADPDGDAVTLQYQWQLDDVNIPGAIQNNYLIAPGQGGDRHLKVVVTPLTESTQTEPSVGGTVTSAVMKTGADLPDGIQSVLTAPSLVYRGPATGSSVTVTLKDRTGKPAVLSGPVTLESNVQGVQFDSPQHCDGKSSICSMRMITSLLAPNGNMLLTVKMNGMPVTGLSKTVEVRGLQLASTNVQTLNVSPLITPTLVLTVVDNIGVPVPGIEVKMTDGTYNNGMVPTSKMTDSQGRISYTPSVGVPGSTSLVQAYLPGQQPITVASYYSWEDYVPLYFGGNSTAMGGIPVYVDSRGGGDWIGKALRGGNGMPFKFTPSPDNYGFSSIDSNGNYRCVNTVSLNGHNSLFFTVTQENNLKKHQLGGTATLMILCQ
jgi:hypothetical protein